MSFGVPGRYDYTVFVAVQLEGCICVCIGVGVFSPFWLCSHGDGVKSFWKFRMAFYCVALVLCSMILS